MRRLGIFTALILLTATPSVHAKEIVERAGAICAKDPRYRVGGGAIGDCLLEMSEKVDTQIAVALEKGVKRYVLAKDIEAYQAIQVAWLDYRRRMCALVEATPGNTASWVSNAACYLELGRQRLHVLRYTSDFGTPRSSE